MKPVSGGCASKTWAGTTRRHMARFSERCQFQGIWGCSLAIKGHLGHLALGKSFSTAHGTKICPPMAARQGEGSPALQPQASDVGGRGEALAALPSCRVVPWSCFICCDLCIAGGSVLGPGLNPASGWVLVCCRYLVRTVGWSEAFFPCRPLEQTVCPRIPCHSAMLLMETSTSESCVYPDTAGLPLCHQELQ